MKRIIIGLFVVGFLVCVGVQRAHADLEVSAGVSIHAAADFYVPLSAQGEWVEISGCGRCWRPAHVAVTWQPYCSGHWQWTDCGWYWVSDEPWSWACYHYGCWYYDPVRFWVWVPGVEWAPAWVTWRSGGGYIGWAPLAPARVGVSVAVATPGFVFVTSDRFLDPVQPSVVVVNNTKIISQTTVINNVRRESRSIGGGQSQKVVINEGPGAAMVQQATGRKLEAVPIQQAARHSPPPPSMARNAAPELKQHQNGAETHAAPEFKGQPGEQHRNAPPPLEPGEKHSPQPAPAPGPGEYQHPKPPTPPGPTDRPHAEPRKKPVDPKQAPDKGPDKKPNDKAGEEQPKDKP